MRAGEGGVQPGTLAGQQLGVQRFLGQRMPEGVGLADRIGDEDLVGDGGAQRGEQLCLGQLGDRGEQPVLDRAGRRGRDPQHRLGIVGKDLDAGQHHVLQAGRQAASVVLLPGGHQLLGEEGVALRAIVDPLEQPGVGRYSEDAGQQVGEVGEVEAVDLEAFCPSASVQTGQERLQGMAAVQLVGPVGQHQQQGPCLQVVHQEGEQVQGRAVGPVQVLYDQYRRRPAGQALQQGQHGLEQPSLRPWAGGKPDRPRLGRYLSELGQQAGQHRLSGSDQLVEAIGPQPPAETAQRLGDWRKRQCALAELDAATEQHLPAALADACCELADQPGLADPGLAANADRHRATAAGLCEGRLEAVELSAPANEAVACDAAGHVTDYAPEQIRRERPAAYRAVPVPQSLRSCSDSW